MHLRYGSVNKKIHKILIKKYLKIHSVKLRFFFKLIKPFWRRFFSFLAKKITLKTKIFFYSIQISRYKIKKKLSIFRSNFIAKKFNKKKICQRNKIGKYKKKSGPNSIAHQADNSNPSDGTQNSSSSSSNTSTYKTT